MIGAICASMILFGATQLCGEIGILATKGYRGTSVGADFHITLALVAGLFIVGGVIGIWEILWKHRKDKKGE